MRKTNAEYQAAYRVKQKEQARRISTWINLDAYFDLVRLSKYYAVSKREILERLLVAESQNVQKSMSEAEQDAYLKLHFTR